MNVMRALTKHRSGKTAEPNPLVAIPVVSNKSAFLEQPVAMSASEQ